MRDGTSGGLVSAAEFQQAQAERARRKAAAAAASSSGSGTGGAAPGIVHRDRTGRVVDIEAVRAKNLADKQREELLWATGKKQREQALQRLAHKDQMAAAPFAQYSTNTNSMRDDALRNRARAEDPMAQFAQRSADQSANNKRRYMGPAGQPNRFGIPPGYRWDGTDRGNGFEVKVLAMMAQQKRHKKQRGM